MRAAILATAFLFVTAFASAQMMGYEVKSTVNYGIAKSDLTSAQTLGEINLTLPSSWIRSYVSTEITVTKNGELVSAAGNSERLSPAQSALLKDVEFGSQVTVRVDYYPENNLPKNDVKDITYSYTVVPKTEASYPGGTNELDVYLRETAVNQILEAQAEPVGTSTYQFSPVKGLGWGASCQVEMVEIHFSISTEGKVINTHFEKSSGIDHIDNLLLESIIDMQSWEPAEDGNGNTVEQEFKFILGYGYGMGC